MLMLCIFIISSATGLGKITDMELKHIKDRKVCERGFDETYEKHLPARINIEGTKRQVTCKFFLNNTKYDEKTFNLTKNNETGLWEGLKVIHYYFNDTGTYKVKAVCEDGSTPPYSNRVLTWSDGAIFTVEFGGDDCYEMERKQALTWQKIAFGLTGALLLMYVFGVYESFYFFKKGRSEGKKKPKKKNPTKKRGR